MKQREFLAPVLIVMILGAWALFTYWPEQPAQQPESTITGEQWSPVTGFKEVNPYPLYVATYVADYRLDEYIRTGSYSASMIRGSPGCTCFYASGSKLYGRNFDFPANPALLLFTQPGDGYASVSMVDLGYFGYSLGNLPDGGSLESLVTAPYMPFDGMNEAGLVVAMAAISHAEPPRDPGKVTLDEIGVIRLLLDRAATVEEALGLLGEYNVQMVDPPIHYLVADKTGESALIEFLGGEMRVIRRSGFQVMTNFLVTETDMAGGTPCSRYNLVHRSLSEAQGTVTLEGTLELLQGASQDSTIWSTVYDPVKLEIHVAMGRGYSCVHTFRLNSTEPR
ncbi:MAG: linear amide C-N hydrolase [Candidatus Bathyarchaeota archaeon]